MSIVSLCRRAIAPGVLVLTGCTFFVNNAHAGVLIATTTDCDSQTLSQPFLQWGDVASYTLAPQGDFEAGSDEWSLTGNAQLLNRNELFFVTDSSDDRSLQLAPGSSATSRAICVGIEHPTLRFFAQRTAGSTASSLTVEVLFEDVLGFVKSATVGTVLGDATWDPTLTYPVAANLLPLLPGERTPVAFRFTPQGSGTWVIDDVYVDPWKGR